MAQVSNETPAVDTHDHVAIDDTATSRRRKPKSSTTSKWSLGILNDHETEEVPGSILLLSKVSKHNAPLGIQTPQAGRPHSPLQSPFSRSEAMFGRPSQPPEKKRTKNGKIILEPQPEESANDPLNWPAIRRDAALLSLGFYCMIGGGMTPILAAGFTNVADTYDVSIPDVALTTGLYMMGLGVGSVIASPTAIAFGKRPVYLLASVSFVLSAVWCAASPNYASLVVARIFQGIAVSPVECLPSATIAEIFFLHERAYRLGIYTLLLLGGKNLVPLVSAAVIQSLGWRWVFWIVAIIVGFCTFLLFFFVPETFWDRTPRPHKPRRRNSFSTFRRQLSHIGHHHSNEKPSSDGNIQENKNLDAYEKPGTSITGELAQRRKSKTAHFVPDPEDEKIVEEDTPTTEDMIDSKEDEETAKDNNIDASVPQIPVNNSNAAARLAAARLQASGNALSIDTAVETRSAEEEKQQDYFDTIENNGVDVEAARDTQTPLSETTSQLSFPETPMHYTKFYREQPKKSFVQSLKPFDGRLNKVNWFKVACRPFVLFAYPAILWSTVVYSLSVGWLIVLSESVASIYRNKETYNFSALSTGLVYLSPFIGGILGTAVAGKVSDILVRFMSKRNGGIYEPEFRLIMAIPIALSTVIGLMGFGWSAQERDAWIVPTIFFGVISFGCSLGSTTAITFAVDSYRQYAGEALVTLNFSKNVLHGLVFSLFFNRWLEADGSKDVFLAIGGIQLGLMLFTIPMYIYGKKLRMWTVRRNLMEKFAS